MHRGRRETEAESVAHLVCRVLGLDTQTYSDAYVLGWAEGDLDLVQACADKVIKVARGILADLTPAPEPADDSGTPPTASPQRRAKRRTRRRSTRTASSRG
jgi:hypothetical protein